MDFLHSYLYIYILIYWYLQQSTIATAEYKPQALVQKFQTFQSSYSFKIQSYMTPGSLESTGQRLKKLLTTELSSLSKLVILQGDSIINNSSSNSLLVDPTAKQLELLAPISSPAHFDNTNGPSIVETPTLIELSGSVKVLGCVHPKSTESDLYHVRE